MPHLETDIWQPLKNRGLSVLAIGREHKLDELVPFKSSLKLTLPVGADTDRSIYSKYAKSGIPRNFIIDQNGKIVFASAGYEEKEFARMKALIEQLLAAKTPLRLASDEIAAAKYDSAIQRLKTILEKSYTNAQAHYLLAVAYTKTKKYADAEAEYNATLKLATDQKLKDFANIGLAKLHPTQK